jgi:hypothetical protein
VPGELPPIAVASLLASSEPPRPALPAEPPAPVLPSSSPLQAIAAKEKANNALTRKVIALYFFIAQPSLKRK